MNLSNVETVLEGLAGSCFYLRWDRNRYRFGLQANLNQVLVQRKGSISAKAVEEQIRKSITDVFNQRPKGIELPRFFPTQTNDIPDKAQLSFVVLGPDHAIGNPDTLPFVEKLIRECGNSGRVFKTGVIVCAPDTTDSFSAAARHFLAWQEIQEDEDTVKDLDESQKRALAQNLERARKDLRESVWRAYRHILFLGKDNKIVPKDLGQITSSMASSLPEYILNDLQQTDQITDRIADRKLISYWPPALTEWSTKAVRDAFFASPSLPRLLSPDLIKRTIADGVTGKVLGYARKDATGKLRLEKFGESLSELEVELSEDVYILKADDAQKLLEPPRLAEIKIAPDRVTLKPGEKTSFACQGLDQYGHPHGVSAVAWSGSDFDVSQNGQVTAPKDPGQYRVTAKAGDFFAEAYLSVSSQPSASGGSGATTPGRNKVRWSGHVPPQKWMNFYTKVLSRFASNASLKLQVSFEVSAETQQASGTAEEVKSSLRDLGLPENVDID